MGVFGFGKKRDKRVIDLTESYRRQQERTENIRRDMLANSNEPASSGTQSSSASQNSGGMFSIFGGATPTASQIPSGTDSENSSDSMASPEERRRKLTKRLLDMTSKIEDISNQIYHLTQRIEVLEKKLRVSEFS